MIDEREMAWKEKEILALCKYYEDLWNASNLEKIKKNSQNR